MKRKHMPNRRETIRQRVTIAGKRLFVDVGLYKEGTVGEIFISVEKTGSDLRSTMDVVARLVSVGLQSGVKLERYITMLHNTRFAPAGVVVGDKRIKFASSPLDYVARYLAVYYCDDDTMAHIKQEDVL